MNYSVHNELYTFRQDMKHDELWEFFFQLCYTLDIPYSCQQYETVMNLSADCSFMRNLTAGLRLLIREPMYPETLKSEMKAILQTVKERQW